VSLDDAPSPKEHHARCPALDNVINGVFTSVFTVVDDNIGALTSVLVDALLMH